MPLTEINSRIHDINRLILLVETEDWTKQIELHNIQEQIIAELKDLQEGSLHKLRKLLET